MTDQFFEHPILHSPYEYPARHWELDGSGQPTQRITGCRRRADFITPIPKPKKRTAKQGEMLTDDKGLSTAKQHYDLTSIINQVRGEVDTWRRLPESQWQVTPDTVRLLKHWLHNDFTGVRPLFCQIERATGSWGVRGFQVRVGSTRFATRCELSIRQESTAARQQAESRAGCIGNSRSH